MRILNGAELAEYIKERQAKQVRALRQAHDVFPKLRILQSKNDPVIDTYVRLKKAYGDDILIEVENKHVKQGELLSEIAAANADPLVHGIIIQLPLEDSSETDAVLNAVASEKDVDALGKDATLDPATPTAINWLLAGYNVQMNGKNIVIVGKGRLVGAPLARMWNNSGYSVEVVDRETDDINAKIHAADIIVSAAGSPGLITSDMIQPEAVVVDAGTASENGTIVGDLAEDVRTRQDLTITPKKGGVGPLTITALFDNVIRSARRVAEAKS